MTQFQGDNTEFQGDIINSKVKSLKKFHCDITQFQGDSTYSFKALSLNSLYSKVVSPKQSRWNQLISKWYHLDLQYDITLFKRDVT